MGKLLVPQFKQATKVAITIVICSILTIVPIAGCSVENQTQTGCAAENSIEEVKQRHEDELLGIEGVVGIGIGECDATPCIIVYVVTKSPELVEAIPKELEGFKVQIEESGDITTE